jgi:hypothetical protein
MLLFFISNKPAEPMKTAQAAETAIKPTGAMKIKRNAPNILTLDYLDLTLGEKMIPKIYYNRVI